MATQGLITVRSARKVIMKVVVGDNGQQATAVSRIIRERWPMSIDEVYEVALSKGFGSTDSLVVITAESHRFDDDDNLSPLYRQTFDQPEFNPRWKHGTAAYVEIIDV